MSGAGLAMICAVCPRGRGGTCDGEPTADRAARRDGPMGFFGPPPRAAGGPGTELKRLLPWFAAQCGPCSDHAEQMDKWGPDRCDANLEVIVGWLRAGARAAGVPFVELAARGLARMAIASARLSS